jgi:hypothetical protein
MDTHALLIWRELLQGSTDPADIHTGYVVTGLDKWIASKEYLEEWVEVARGTEAEIDTLFKLTQGVNDDIT